MTSQSNKPIPMTKRDIIRDTVDLSLSCSNIYNFGFHLPINLGTKRALNGELASRLPTNLFYRQRWYQTYKGVLILWAPIFVLQSHLSKSSKGRIESFSKMPVNDGCKNLGHGVVIKRVNWYNIEMTCEPGWYIITASTGGTHGRNE